MDYRQQLEQEYQEMISKMNKMIDDNMKTISKSNSILKTTKTGPTKRQEARIYYSG